MLITKTSLTSGISHSKEMNITLEQFLKVESGEGYIQDICPHLSADDREFLLTGITSEEWAAMFDGSEDEPEDFQPAN